MTAVFSLLPDTNASGEEASSWPSAPEERFHEADFVASGRVLIVDDEPIVRSLVARLLEEDGHTVLVAPNGAQALQIAETDPLGFDLIVTDIRMPGMDGWQLGRRIGQRWPGMPILYMSGLDLDDSTPGRHALLRKPFDGAELLRRVRDLLRGR